MDFHASITNPTRIGIQMIFSEGVEVKYKDMYGIIDFVCESYIVIEVSSPLSENPARLLIYEENYNQIDISKASNK